MTVNQNNVIDVIVETTKGVDVVITQPPTLEAVLVTGRPGRSAYEAWVELGNTGTPEDFLQWIVDQVDLRERTAINTIIEDTANVFDSTNVEGALSELYVKTLEVADITFVHEQMAASSTWDIIHNLNKYPSVTIIDLYGSVVIGEIRYISANEIQLTFTAPFSGRAILN